MLRRGPSFDEAEVSSRGSSPGEVNLLVLGPIQRLGPVADHEQRPAEREWWIEKTPSLPSGVPHVERDILGMYQCHHGAFFIKELGID
jgi:hypothetical protein